MTAAAVRLDAVLPAAPRGAWDAPLSLAVPEGAFFVLQAAPARAGALLRICLGLAAAGAGTVEVLGANPGALDRRASQRFRRALGSGLVPHGLISNLTLRMNVIVPLVYGGLALPADAARRADDALAACGAQRWAHERPADVPPDARQRAVVARAIAREPQLLLLEDPVWSVDADVAAGLLALCRAHARTVLVTTPRRDAAVVRAADHSASWDDAGFRMDTA